MVKLHWAKKYFKKNQDFNPRTTTIRSAEADVSNLDCLKAHLKFGRYLRSKIFIKKIPAM